MTIEVRTNPDGSLDGVWAENATVNLHQIDDGVWWLGLTNGNQHIDVTLYTKKMSKHIRTSVEMGS